MTQDSLMTSLHLPRKEMFTEVNEIDGFGRCFFSYQY